MITIIGKIYKNCKHTAGGHPIPETIRLEVDGYKRNPLYFHTRNLLQTSTGFGKNLKTEHMISIGNKWHRVYYTCSSNCSTYFVKKYGKDIVIDPDDVGIC